MFKQNCPPALAAPPHAGGLPALLVLASFLGVVTPLRAQNPPTYVFEIDSSAVPGGFGPSFVALDSSNNLYASGASGGGIAKFSGSGTYLTQWGGYATGDGLFFSPMGIAVDSSNNVYGADWENNRIVKFSSSGTYLTQWGDSGAGNGQFEYPYGIAVDSSNNVYVTDEDNDRVEKFSSDGAYLTQWGGRGSGNGQFYGVQGVAVDGSNNVYVADYGNDRIQKFSGNGTYLAQWGGAGRYNGQLYSPQGIAVDSSNNVYVADYGNDRIQKFDGNGNYLSQWGGFGSGNGQFDGPQAVAVDRSGNSIYVVDYYNGRIQLFVNSTNIIPPYINLQPASQTVPIGSSVTFSVGALGPALSYQWNSNNVPVPGATNATLTLNNVSLSVSATYTVRVSNSYGSQSSGGAVLLVEFTPTYLFEIDAAAVPGGFDPNFVALDRSNNVYVTDSDNYRIEKFSRGGAYLTQWGGRGTNNGQFVNPEGVVVDTSNNVYVADYGNSRIEKFDSNGNFLTQWGGAGTNNGQFDDPEGLAVDGSNNVYLADAGDYEANTRIEVFTSNGAYLTHWGGNGDGEDPSSYFNGIAVDSSNHVYVADGDNPDDYRIEKFSGSGNSLAQWGGAGSGDGQFYYPVGVAVDSSNHVYVADSGNNRIEEFGSSGMYLTQWGGEGNGNGQFHGPQGIAVDSSGNFIYVADSGNRRIEVFVNNTNIIPPFITNPPASQTFLAGIPVGNVTFSVGVIGTAPFVYQWNSNNVAVPGATNATLTLTNASGSDSGNYSVLVTNPYGGVLSGVATLAFLPAFVTTAAAGGISAMGAVLNGSVIVGLDETVVWFDWGTDTNYGNITDATIVPGNRRRTNLGAALSGLPGNVYHYRLDAANDFGIVYGEDQSFTVGFAPTATTLGSDNSSNGPTLNAVVNPGGWDTTVYFQWGTPALTNTTPGINVGAGAASFKVSSAVPGLAPATPYQYQVVASNALGTVFGQAVSWNQLAPTNRYRFSGWETNITLDAGTYLITAYGAPGGTVSYGGYGGLGAEMSGEFNFSSSTILTLLVGSVGGGIEYGGGGGGGGSFVVQGSTPLIIAGGGGGGGITGNGGNASVSTDGGIATGGYGGGGGSGYGGTGGGGGGGGDNPGGGGGGGGGFLGNGGYGGGEYPGFYGYSFENGAFGGEGDGSPGEGGGYGGGSTGDGGGFGGGGGGGGYGGGGGGGYSGGGGGNYYNISDADGGGGGSIINSSAIAVLAEVSGIASPDNPGNGEIIITAVSTPIIITTGAAFGSTNGVFGFDVAGPSGSNVIIQASTDLQTWVPLQTNLLGGGLLYFSDSRFPANGRCFYRAQLSP